MDFFELILLALIQGLTEFLPISSSAHLILPSQLLGWQDQGITYDVAVHLGTLIAVMSYYRHSLWDIWSSVSSNPLAIFKVSSQASSKIKAKTSVKSTLSASVSLSPTSASSHEVDHFHLLRCLFIATLPVLLVGFLAHHWIVENLRSLWVIASSTLIFGVLLGVTERFSKQRFKLADITLTIAFFIGCAQVLALIPGTSRSGITITAALFLGLRSTDAAHFSFLISIPTILAAAILEIYELTQQVTSFNMVDLVAGALVSGVSAYVTIALFIKLLDKIGMMPFVIYRIGLAAILFYIIA